MSDQPTTSLEPEPDLRITATGAKASLQLGGVDIAKWVTRADLRIDANSYLPSLYLELNVPGVVAEVTRLCAAADVEARIDPALAALLRVAGWTEPGPF